MTNENGKNCKKTEKSNECVASGNSFLKLKKDGRLDTKDVRGFQKCSHLITTDDSLIFVLSKLR